MYIIFSSKPHIILWDSSSIILFFFFFSFYGHTYGIWKFPG